MPIERRPFRRRKLSMTSLIDVIFLLLLFFMLSSTFARHGEIGLTAAASGTPEAPETPPLFLRLTPGSITLNGEPVASGDLASAVSARTQGASTEVLLALAGPVSSQSLVDALAALRRVPGARVTVIE